MLDVDDSFIRVMKKNDMNRYIQQSEICFLVLFNSIDAYNLPIEMCLTFKHHNLLTFHSCDL